MTFQPPPPPPGANPPPPPPPPPGQWGPPSGGGGYPQPRAGFDPKTVNPLDWAILGLGLLTFIFSFFGYYTASVSVGGFSSSSSAGAWHASGGAFVAWLGMALAVIGAAVLALALFAPQVRLPIESRIASLGLFTVGSLLMILAIFVHPKFYDGGGLSFGHGFSFWLSLIMILAATVLSLMRVQQTGGQLPGALNNLPNIGGRGPQSGPPQAPPPPPGYGPPPGA